MNLPDSSPAKLKAAQPAAVEPHRLGPVFRFRDKPFFAKASIVRISRPGAVLIVEAHSSFLARQNFNAQYVRLNAVLQHYSHGISRILDYSASQGGPAWFHLDLSDISTSGRGAVTPADQLYAFVRRKQDSSIGLVPDPYTLGDMAGGKGFMTYDSEKDAKADYDGRANVIFWRGATTGRKDDKDIMSNQRIQFCRKALEYGNRIDAKISMVVQFRNNHRAFQELQKAGVMALRVNESDFAAYKATVDLDGNSAAWGTMRKYLRLIHVIKPDSEFEMFYSIGQPEDSYTRIEDADDLFRRLENSANLADNFAKAWNGHRYAQSVRQNIKSGAATIFPA